MRWFILGCFYLLVFFVSAQTTYIDQLHDSLKPQIIDLDQVPPPKIISINQPEEKEVTSDITRGQAFFTNFTSDDGLPMDAVSFGKSTLCDSKGNLWFATQGGGVSKYDGKSFNNYSIDHGLANNAVYAITEDRHGNIWFGTHEGGVSKYDGKSFTTFTTEQGLTNNTVLSLMEDRLGNLWFGTVRGGVSKYNGKSFTTYTTEQGLVNNLVYKIVEDKHGNLWFATKGGVSRYDGISFTNYTTEEGLADNEVLSIAEDQSGNLWFGTDHGGLSKYDGKSFVTYSIEHGLPANSITCMYEDKSGIIWFGTINRGICKYDGKSFITYNTEHGLAHNTVYSITKDKMGSLWIGTFGGGVSRYDGESFISYTTEHGLKNNLVQCVLEDQLGNLWVGTLGGGISKYNGKSFITYSKEHGLGSNMVVSIAEDRLGNIWIGTYGGGVSKYDGKSFITYTSEQGLSNNIVLSIIQDQSGNLWFGTETGLNKFNGESFTTYRIEQGLVHNSVASIFEDKAGNVWIGTTGGGISKYDGKSFTNYTMEDGLPNNYVVSIAEDQSGSLWFGTSGGGISVFNGKTFRNYSSEHGLPDNNVGALRFDEKNRLIIGTNYGLAVLSPEGIDAAINDGRFENIEIYNQFTGYLLRSINNGTNNGAIHIDKEGVLWVGHGKNGLTRVDLDAVNKSEDKPNVVINKVRLKGEDICYYSLKHSQEKKQSNTQDLINQDSLTIRDSLILTQQEFLIYRKVLSHQERDALKNRFLGVTFDSITSFYSLPKNLVLPYEHNAIAFEYNAIETGRNFLINYQYKLKGFEDDWSAITKKSEVNYNNLREGKYTFLLKAQSPWGVWSDPIEFSFEVLPPWYRTIWAYACYLIIGFLLISGLVQIQTRRLKQQSKVLEKKVESATNEVVKEKREAERQRDEAEEQKKLAEEQRILVEQNKQELEKAHKQLALNHKEIQDSINYAKRIQKAIMPSISSLAEALKDGFVIYEPKGVVAGDFFWMESLGDVVYFAAADCTGHGVPGAMVSMVCSNALTKSLLEEGITDTGKLLDKTREIVIDRFARSGDEVKDGMDISLCALNMKTRELKWTGANNPLWITRSAEGGKFELDLNSNDELLNGVQIGKNELIEIKPDKQPIGKYSRPEPFTTHTMRLNKEDTIYAFTDGYQDQFGGPKGKKFRARQFKELLAENHHKSMSEIHMLLVEKFREWQGNQEQVDDVCIIGVRL